MIKNDQQLRNIATRVSETSTTLIHALNDLIEMGQQVTQGGLNFTGVDFSTIPELQHLDADVITSVFSSAEATKNWLASSFNATNFQKARFR